MSNADRLAREVARLVENKVIDERSRAADRLLDYLCIGQPGGPASVPEWCEHFDKQAAAEGGPQTIQLGQARDENEAKSG